LNITKLSGIFNVEGFFNLFKQGLYSRFCAVAKFSFGGWRGFTFALMPKRFGLPKSERLKSRKQIDALFAGGKSFLQTPVRVSYQFMPSADKNGLQIGVTASKRHFKKSVDRNRIKRLLREAYRLQKEDVLLTLKDSQKTGIVFFIYTDKTIASFETIKATMAKCLQRLSKIAQSENPS
jgi:ribonuclease P protein component